MKKYRLLKDLPLLKAGAIFALDDYGCLYYKDENNRISFPESNQDKMKRDGTFDEWFEEIKVNKCWRPEQEEEYTYVLDDGTLAMTIYIRGNEHDEARIEMGNCFKGKREAFIISEKLRALRRLREKGLRFDHALRYGERLIDGRENAGFISISFSNDVDGQKDNPMKFDENIQRDLDLLFKEEK